MSLYVNCRYHREFDKFMLNIMYTMNHTGIADTVIFCDSWGYEGSDIAEKRHYQRYWVIFSAMIAAFITRMNHQGKYFIVYIYTFL